MKNIIVTNNHLVRDKFHELFQVEFIEGLDYLKVMFVVRDKLHMGHQLLTHPLSGSIKPNETPYKSIIISGKKGELDQSGLIIVEESIVTATKFIENKSTPNWPESILDDFRVIDLSLMENVIERLGHR